MPNPRNYNPISPLLRMDRVSIRRLMQKKGLRFGATYLRGKAWVFPLNEKDEIPSDASMMVALDKWEIVNYARWGVVTRIYIPQLLRGKMNGHKEKENLEHFIERCAYGGVKMKAVRKGLVHVYELSSGGVRREQDVRKSACEYLEKATNGRVKA